MLLLLSDAPSVRVVRRKSLTTATVGAMGVTRTHSSPRHQTSGRWSHTWQPSTGKGRAVRKVVNGKGLDLGITVIVILCLHTWPHSNVMVGRVHRPWRARTTARTVRRVAIVVGGMRGRVGGGVGGMLGLGVGVSRAAVHHHRLTQGRRKI